MCLDLTSLVKGDLWVPWLAGSRLRISSTAHCQYRAAVARAYRETRHCLDDLDPASRSQEILAWALAQVVLLDWDGITWVDETGAVVENLPYTKERGQRALLAVDPLREFVIEQAGKPTAAKAEILEEAVKHLTWWLKWGNSLDALKLYQKRTGIVPPALLEKPEEASPEASFYLGAFDFLSSFRGSNGFSLTPISYSDIAHYAEKVGHTEPDEFFFLAEVVGALDREYRRIKEASKQ